ncbi:MAG: translocation/assembly module TamB domain-containing protein [Parahaliea sp.]
MRRLAVVGLLVLLLLPGLLCILPFSESGSRLLAAGLSHFTPLKIDWQGGRLFGRFQVRQLSLHREGLEFSLSDIDAKWQVSCLWQREICISRFSAGTLQLVLAGSDEKNNQETGQKSPDAQTQNRNDEPVPIQFPVRMQAPDIQIKQLHISWPGGSWQQAQAQIHLAVAEQAIRAGGRIEDGLLSLAASEPHNSDSSDPLRLPTIWLPFDIDINTLELLRPGLVNGDTKEQLERLAVQINGSGHQLKVPVLNIRHRQWGELDLVAKLTLDGQWPLTAAATFQPGPGVDLPSAIDTGRFSLQATGDFADLELSLDSDGRQQLALTAQLDVLADQPVYQLDGQLQWSGGLPLAGLPGIPVALESVVLASPLTLSSEGGRAEQTLKLTLTASGLGYQQAALHLDARHYDNKVRLNTLDFSEPAGGSALSLAGELSYGEALTADIDLSSPGFTLPALSDALQGQLKGGLNVQAQFAGDHWSAALHQVVVDGQINTLPASIHGDVELNSQDYLADGQLNFELNGASGVLQALAEDAGATLTASVSDLSRWLEQAQGNVDIRVDIGATDQILHFKVQSNKVGWQQWQLGNADASGYLKLDDRRIFGLQLKAVNLGQEGMMLSALNISVDGSASQRQAKLELAGDIDGDLALTLNQVQDQWQGELLPATLTFTGERWQLAKSVALTVTKDSLHFAAHCWQGPAASLCLHKGQAGSAGQVAATLEGTLSLVQTLMAEGVTLQGDLKAELDANWSEKNPLAANLSLSVGEGVVGRQLEGGQYASWQWQQLTASASYHEGVLQLQSQLQQEERTMLAIEAQLGADRNGPLAGQVRLDHFELAALQAFVPDLSLIGGVLEGGWDIAGTAARPHLNGQLNWRDGELAVVGSPTELRDMQARFDFEDGVIALDARGQLGEGPISLSGQLKTLPDWHLQLTVNAEHNRLAYPPIVEAVASSQLTVSARQELVELSGKVQVTEGLIRQDRLPEDSVGLSRDVVMVNYRGEVLQETQPFDSRIDIRVDIADQFRVQVVGVDALLGGELQLQQRPGHPLQLYGNLNMEEGSFEAYGQHLALKRGRISFAGAPQNPEIDLRAERDISLEQVKAGVQVQGTVETPRLEIYSEPAMSQPEALSYLIRGRGLDAGTGMDGTALALSLGTGLVNRSALVEGLNRLPGLNNVEFGAETIDDDTAATVSGYIGERIFLSYGVGLYEPVNVVTARLYLSTRLWLEVVSRLESSVDLYYRFEID